MGFTIFIVMALFWVFTILLLVFAFVKSGEPYESKILGLFGKRGQGKSLYSVFLVDKYLRTTDLDIYYELALNKEYIVKYYKKKYKKDVSERLKPVKIKTLQEMVLFMKNIRKAVIIFDEAHVHFPSDDRAIPRDVQDIKIALNVSRHRDITLVYITQKFNSVNTQLRLVTDKYFFCSKVWDRFRRHTFRISVYEQELFQPPKSTVKEDGSPVTVNPTSEKLQFVGDAMAPSKKYFKWYNYKGSGDLQMLVNDYISKK